MCQGNFYILQHDEAIHVSNIIGATEWHLVIFFIDNDKIRFLDKTMRKITNAQTKYRWVVREKLRSGRLKWSTIKFLTPHLIPENLQNIRKLHDKIDSSLWKQVKSVSFILPQL